MDVCVQELLVHRTDAPRGQCRRKPSLHLNHCLLAHVDIAALPLLRGMAI